MDWTHASEAPVRTPRLQIGHLHFGYAAPAIGRFRRRVQFAADASVRISADDIRPLGDRTETKRWQRCAAT
jgi:hypothetical protein